MDAARGQARREAGTTFCTDAIRLRSRERSLFHMRGKTVVITGATSGIGEVAAIRLAQQGARIVFTARDEKRGQATLEKLNRANGAAEHVMHLADLSLVAEQKRVAGEIAREPLIDVLINNAGALFN